jgi:glycosyltransferase involved in cell wall biosynthesis
LFGKYIYQLVGVSNYTTNYILKDFGTHLKYKSKTIYNGIDISSCKIQNLNRTKKPFKFIVVSHLRESKGIQDLLKALSLLDASIIKNISVDIFGEGPYKEHLRIMCNSFKLDEFVHFKGSSPNVNELLSEYHYLIQPTYMECFSLSLLESLACNVPVITTDVGGNMELIENGVNGYIFKPKDVHKLSDILTKIITNEMGITSNVRTLVEKKFTLNKMVEDHVNLVKCI